MKKPFLALCVCAAAALTANIALAETDYGNIRQGDFEAGGSVSYSNVSPSGSSSYSLFDLGAPLQYFVADRLSVGGTLAYSSLSGGGYASTSVFSFGPSAAYYLWSQDRLAAFAAQDVSYNKYSGYGYYISEETRVGLNYFVTPSVALGPSLQFRHRFGRDTLGDLNAVTLAGRFTLYL